MAEKYVYGVDGNTTTFGARDSLPPGNTQKIISGSQFDTEFLAVADGKLDRNDDGTGFVGTIDGGVY
jgi:hypothetical protein